jgi:hypothetical protein
MFKDIFDFSYFDKKSANDTSSKKIVSEISFKNFREELEESFTYLEECLF